MSTCAQHFRTELPHRAGCPTSRIAGNLENVPAALEATLTRSDTEQSVGRENRATTLPPCATQSTVQALPLSWLKPTFAVPTVTFPNPRLVRLQGPTGPPLKYQWRALALSQVRAPSAATPHLHEPSPRAAQSSSPLAEPSAAGELPFVVAPRWPTEALSGAGTSP